MALTHQHGATVSEVLDVARRLASRLFCGFDRWAAAVHRPSPPKTVPQAAAMLGALCYPVAPLQFQVHFNQINAYSLGPGLVLATNKLRRSELDDLKWLAHATSAWRIGANGATPVRQGFVGDAVLGQAHANMVSKDNNRWGGLVPPQLAAMVRHGVNVTPGHTTP